MTLEAYHPFISQLATSCSRAVCGLRRTPSVGAACHNIDISMPLIHADRRHPPPPAPPLAPAVRSLFQHGAAAAVTASDGAGE